MSRPSRIEAAPLPAALRLADALTRLGRIDGLPAQARAALAEAEAALAELRSILPEPAPVVDRSLFDALLAMAGPEVARELVVQMAADLAAVADALHVSLPANDWADIRARTHVLAAIAGSAGAMPLAQSAGRLNRAAAAQDRTAVAEEGAVLLPMLARVIRFVEAALPEGGRGS